MDIRDYKRGRERKMDIKRENKAIKYRENFKRKQQTPRKKNGLDIITSNKRQKKCK